MTTRAENIAYAKIALAADRWDDMMDYMEAAAAQHGELSHDEVDGSASRFPPRIN